MVPAPVVSYISAVQNGSQKDSEYDDNEEDEEYDLEMLLNKHVRRVSAHRMFGPAFSSDNTGDGPSKPSKQYKATHLKDPLTGRFLPTVPHFDTASPPVPVIAPQIIDLCVEDEEECSHLDYDSGTDDDENEEEPVLVVEPLQELPPYVASEVLCQPRFS